MSMAGIGIPQTQSVGKDHSSAAGLQCSVRVVITEAYGCLTELWLPPSVEGRFFFDINADGENYPIYIQAIEGQWVLVCENGSFLETGPNAAVKSAVLLDRSQFKLRYLNREFFIYSEAERYEDSIFIPYRIMKCNNITVGRLPACDIQYDSIVVSRVHASLSWHDDNWYVRDENSTNGVYLNGRSVATPAYTAAGGVIVPENNEAILSPGDSIYIMGLRIVMGIDYIGVNNGGGRVRMTSQKVQRLMSPGAIEFHPLPFRTGDEFFNRLPRRRSILDPEPIEFEAPPNPLSNKMPLLMRVGSPLLMGGRAIMTGNVFSALTSMLMPMLTQGYTEKDRKEYEALRATKYKEYLNHKKKELLSEVEREQEAMTYNYPELKTLLENAEHQERLWERQRSDSDFLSVRIGKGDIPMVAERNYPQRRFDLEKDELEEEMYKLAEQDWTLKDMPVMLSLKEHYVCGILGERAATEDLLRNIIVQLAFTHAYDEVKIVLIADEACTKRLESLLYLPHFWSNDRTVRYAAASRSEAQQLSKQLMVLYDKHLAASKQTRNQLKAEPAYVVLVQNRDIFDAIEILKTMTMDDEYIGFSIVTGFDTPPKDCSALIQMGDPCSVSYLRESKEPDQTFALDFYPENYAKVQLHRIMDSRLKLPEQQGALPEMVTFLDMYHVGMVEHLNPLKRWRDNNPVKSLAAPIGVGADGTPFTLDLHEKKQGPHGLVAGGTGSGKSEFIITYILSMAVNFSPDEVAFLLIDYKGGGLADAFVDKKRGIHLPHVVGTITNLDGAGIHRSLVAINSELKRRQSLFSQAKSETNEGTMDIYDYQRLYRQGRVKKPLPHLFIISDEFAELKKQQPEFMDELISTARIGRSLGVHLILATQKPSGVVNDQIWSNTKFRVCLRVAEKNDSMEMLKRPEAAEIRNTGRFYLQVGYNELFVQGQSAWCGAGYAPREYCATEADRSVQFVDRTGQIVLNAKPDVQVVESGTKQIVAIVQYLSDLAVRQRVKPQMLWEEPLAERIELTDLMRKAPSNGTKQINAVLGLVDDPERQQQFPFVLDMRSIRNLMIVGGNSQGKSTFLKSMLYSLTARYTPEELNYYITDFSGSALNSFRKMPHCGAYLTGENEADFIRLMAFMRAIAEERRKLFAEADVTSYDAYLQVHPLPLILFVMDSYQNMITSYTKGAEISSQFHTFMSDLSAYGIRVVISISHSNEISMKSKQELDCRVALCPKDRYDATDVVGGKVTMIPKQVPGRGVCVIEERRLEFHTASLFCDQIEQAAAQKMKQELDKLTEAYAGMQPAKRLPVLNSDMTYPEFCGEFQAHRIPLGYHVKDLKPVAIPMRQIVSMPIYFGNPFGVRPILQNVLAAAKRENAELIVIRKNEDSAFAAHNNLLSGTDMEYQLYSCNQTDLSEFGSKLNTAVSERNNVVNEYSDANGISRSERGRAKKAAKYMLEHTVPVIVLIESFADLAAVEMDDVTVSRLKAFFGGLKGYNIYFFACFYPTDTVNLRSNQLIAPLLNSEQQLFFGGRYHMQWLAQQIPLDLRRQEHIEPEYNRLVLHYRESWYQLQMPCGVLDTPDMDPDDAPIL